MYKNIFTNPNEHDPDSFVYLVAGFDGLDTDKFLGKLRNPEDFHPAYLIGNLRPDIARQKLGWYGGPFSMIRPKHSMGYIIEIPGDDVIQIAWDSHLDPDKCLKDWVNYYTMFGRRIRYPTVLFKSPYNSFILRGHSDTNITGVFYISLDRNGPEELPIEEGANEAVMAISKAVSQYEAREIDIVRLPFTLSIPKQRLTPSLAEFYDRRNVPGYL